jgi:iron complex transport system substrate-binding protein
MKLKKYMILILICVLGCMLIVVGCEKSDSKKEPKEPTTVTIIDSAGN